MPDFIVLRQAPAVITAPSPRAAITQALAAMPEYDAATGSFSVALWVGVPNGQLVNVTVTVSTSRSITVDVLP